MDNFAYIIIQEGGGKGTKSIAKNSFYNIIYNIVNMLFPLITSAYVSRIILEDGIGRVAIAQNVVDYFLIIAALGFPAYGVREIAKVKDDYRTKCKVFTELVVINTVSTLIALVLFFGLICNADSMCSQFSLYLSCGLTLFLQLFNIDWLFQADEEYRYIATRSFIIKVLSLLAILIFVRTKADYVLFALITSLAVGGNNFLNILRARKFVAFDFRELHITRHIKPMLILTLAAALGGIYNKIDVTMIGAISTDAVAGYYSNAHKAMLVAVYACAAISSVFLPRLAYYYKNDLKQFKELVELGCRILTFITVPAAAGLFLIAPNLMAFFFGEHFRTASSTMRIFSLMIIIRPFGDLLCYQLLICAGSEGKRIPVYLMATLINICLNAILIPAWAQNGAAVASVVSELFVNGVLLLTARKIVPFSYDREALKQAILSTVVMCAVVLAVLALRLSDTLTVLLSVAAGFVVYIICNLLFHNKLALQGAEYIKNLTKRAL